VRREEGRREEGRGWGVEGGKAVVRKERCVPQPVSIRKTRSEMSCTNKTRI
jgi:hypothetical protein